MATIDDDGVRSPFILVEMPFPCTRKGLVEAICGAMGHEPAEDWRTTKIVDEIARFIELHHVRMIAIDEADRIIGADTADVGHFLVSLLNRVKAQVVMAGAPEVANLHTGWGLGRRLQKGLVLDPYRWDTVEGQTTFRAMLDVFDSKLGFAEKSGLQAFDMSQRLDCDHGERAHPLCQPSGAPARRRRGRRARGCRPPRPRGGERDSFLA